MSQRKFFYADIASGLQSCTFTMSSVVDGIRYNNLFNQVKFPFWAFSSNGEFGREWIREDEYRQKAERIIALVKRPADFKFFSDRLQKSIKEGEELKKILWRLLPKLRNLDQNQLLKTYNEFVKKYHYYFGLGTMTFVYETTLSEKFSALLIKNGRPTGALAQILKSDYRSFMLKSELELKAIKKEKQAAKRERLINKYLADFYYIQTDYHEAPVLDRRYVLNHLKRQISHRPAATKRINLRLTAEENKLARLLQLAEAIHDCRKKINQIGTYGLFRFLEEASRRSHLSLGLCRRAFWLEYEELLKRPGKMLKILKKRRLASLVFDNGRCYYLGYPALKERSQVKGVTEFRGVSASGGESRGRARLVFSRGDFGKVKPGDILVTTMTRPEFLPAVRRAGAVITEEGGITSHAAVVARELKIPCVVGLKNLTRIVKDGYLLKVDANEGTVKIIKK